MIPSDPTAQVLKTLPLSAFIAEAQIKNSQLTPGNYVSLH